MQIGILYGNTYNITLDTPGRTRIVFEDSTSNNIFSFDADNLTGNTFRAYIIYEDASGTEIVEYSNSIIN